MKSSSPTDAFSATAEQIVEVFHACFFESHKTQLMGGFDEPLYMPVSGVKAAEIQFREDFAASALHEVAHWCVAGPARRCLEDYGYWYQPDGRNAEQQQAFEQVEVKPQAMEWLFAKCCGIRFKLSADNLALDAAVSEVFAQRYHQVNLSENLQSKIRRPVNQPLFLKFNHFHYC